MNKKFSTLMALALLAGSFPVAAQFCTVNGEVPYHTRLVKAAALDANISGVKKSIRSTITNCRLIRQVWLQVQV